MKTTISGAGLPALYFGNKTSTAPKLGLELGAELDKNISKSPNQILFFIFGHFDGNNKIKHRCKTLVQNCLTHFILLKEILCTRKLNKDDYIFSNVITNNLKFL